MLVGTRLGGAWGLQLPRVVDRPGLLIEAPPEWPQVEVRVVVTPEPARVAAWEPARAEYELLGGNHIRIDRDPARIELQLRRPTPPEAVIAPHLAAAASTFAVWRGEQAFHAGTFVGPGGGAWALLGEKAAGKSSTLGAIGQLGATIVADDVSIYSAGAILAAPRCLDLRPSAARALGAGRDLGVIGTRERWRVDLPACPPSVPLRGWILLDWGEEADLAPIPPGERLTVLPRHVALRAPWADPQLLIELVSYPMFRWRRPHGIGHLQRGAEWLIDSIGHVDAG